MVQYFTDEDVLYFSWQQVATAFWTKYPDPDNPYILAVDTVSREVKPDGKLYTTRLIKKRSPSTDGYRGVVPPLFITYAIEDSVVDPVNKVMTTTTQNLSNPHVSTSEHVVYRNLEDGKAAWTHVNRSVFVNSSIGGLTGKLVEKMAKKAVQGKRRLALENFQGLLTKMYRPASNMDRDKFNEYFTPSTF